MAVEGGTGGGDAALVVDEILYPDGYAGQSAWGHPITGIRVDAARSIHRRLVVEVSEDVECRLAGVSRGEGTLDPIDGRHRGEASATGSPTYS